MVEAQRRKRISALGIQSPLMDNQSRRIRALSYKSEVEQGD